MAAIVKSRLKTARDALSKKDYITARDSAVVVLEFEPNNYNANVFLGLASIELGDKEKSEQAYLRAIESNPSQALGWQGLSRLYERTEQWRKYDDTLLKVMDLATDPIKCAENLQKLLKLRQERGSRAQIVDGLALLLPGSRYYDLLSTLPPPDPTNPTSSTVYDVQVVIQNTLPVIEEIVSIIEREEGEGLKREVDRRRTRLGASGPEQLKKDVGIEIWSKSKLPLLYNEITNHPRTSEEVRRQTENKLLDFKKNYLFALPPTSPEKKRLFTEVEEIVNGVVLLKLPNELAWMLFFDTKDTDTVEGYDYSTLRLFVELFPSHYLADMIRGYFMYYNIPLQLEGEEEKADDAPDTVEDPDIGLDMMLDAQSRSSDSVLATRMLADAYLREIDYANAIKIAEHGASLIRRVESDCGKSLARSQLGFQVSLGTALVHLFPPKHHSRALPIIDEVLKAAPDNVHALMARAYIMQEAKNWQEAAELFEQVAATHEDDPSNGILAKEEAAWCKAQLGERVYAVSVLKEVFEYMDTLADFGSEIARCLWRIGVCLWDMGGEPRTEAYGNWIKALKYDAMYAPAFTSLGKYYEEQANPADPVRASKCFQKAFELDSREVYAAHRLAVGFAEEREWDLVEVVARRTIEGEGGLDAGLDAAAKTSASMFTPMNTWAWKALGAVEIVRGHYPQAIQAFQVALRAEPDDQLSWLRLGEAYSKAGRQAAALKALTRAHELQPDGWMASYLIADVRRQVGQYDEAVNILKDILAARPLELGVSVLLAQTHLDLGKSELANGFIARAETTFLEALKTSIAIVDDSAGFRGVVWKVAADALYNLASRPTFADESAVRTILDPLLASLTSNNGDRLAGLNILPNLNAETLTGSTVLQCAILAYDLRLSVSSSSPQALGSAWYDLSTALRTYAETQTDEQIRTALHVKSIALLTSALKQCPGNEELWVALANAYFISQPKSAQHAFIRALEIDAKNASIWANLGLLYLYHSDLDLANEALLRAQTIDPDNTLAWVGQALVAASNGHDRDARALLEHAVGLLSSVPFADMEYSNRVFAVYRSSPSTSSKLTLLPALPLMSRFLTRQPTSVAGLHLFSLINEAIGHLKVAQDLLSQATAILEAAYEETESAEIERQYVMAQANMGRIQLSMGDFEAACECFETVSGLLAEETDGEATVLKVESHFLTAMGKFRQGVDIGEVLASFEEAMSAAGDDSRLAGHVSVLQAKIMWASGDNALRDQAKEMLLERLATDEGNLTVINSLAAMGILTDDESLVDAALSEILSLPREQRAEADPDKEVDYLLIKHHQALGDYNSVYSLAQHALFAEPSNAEARVVLASLKMVQGSQANALPILTGSSTASIDTDSKVITLRAVARAGQDARASLREAQRAVMLAPWDGNRWLALAYAKAGTAK
ncbi:superkiller protein 3 [Cylindrobasidium torrendii FP15055 ss-10]|uniref:Superkiller protein 3 n=1 Tax=Cylindrobasidium torrendii FP15055 ss-10 TaxID=1314674 RepID=A0A0D7BS98_9AGAR|nr:superkiller protein 3 [Cylindrobasidium torrendii FP15055 ss-10]